jgi:hypothetical protein
VLQRQASEECSVPHIASVGIASPERHLTAALHFDIRYRRSAPMTDTAVTHPKFHHVNLKLQAAWAR